MTTEDYNKYYIQGSDHYLIPRDELKSLLKENQELKKQLENCYCNRTDCSGRIKDSKVYDSLVQKVETQQQEFIKWLENKIHTIETTYSQINGNYGLMNEKLEALKEVLREYKKIIGGDKDEK